VDLDRNTDVILSRPPEPATRPLQKYTQPAPESIPAIGAPVAAAPTDAAALILEVLALCAAGAYGLGYHLALVFDLSGPLCSLVRAIALGNRLVFKEAN